MPFAQAYQFVTPGHERLLIAAGIMAVLSLSGGWQIIRHAASDLRLAT